MICILIGAALVSLVVAKGHGNSLHEKIEAANERLLEQTRSINGVRTRRTQSDILIKEDPIPSVNGLRIRRTEGDILKLEDPALSNNTLFKRKSAVLRSMIWKDGKIPYTLDSKYSDSQRKTIAKGVAMWNDHTCLDIYKRKGDESNYVKVVAGQGCMSFVGFIKNMQPQELTLALVGCSTHAEVVAHEFGHALGFNHEQSRPDRDNYVTIKWENVNEDRKHNFEKADEDMSSDYGLPYDMNSIMHYGSTYFSKNGQPTIVPKDKSSKVVVGGLWYLSFLDIKAVNIVYQCSDKCPVKLNCLDDGYQKGPAKSGESAGCQCWCKKDGKVEDPEELCERQPSGGSAPTTNLKTTAAPSKTTTEQMRTTTMPSKTTTDQQKTTETATLDCQDKKIVIGTRDCNYYKDHCYLSWVRKPCPQTCRVSRCLR